MGYSKYFAKKKHILAMAWIVLGVALDQWTKYLAVCHLKNQDPLVLIDNVFQLCYLENRGAAFGVFQNQTVFFLIAALVIILVLLFAYIRLPEGTRYLPLKACMLCIITGAAGNLIDRMRFGYVIDFFYFNLIDFPIFNVADIFVTISAFLLMILMLFYYKESDFEVLFQH